MKKNIFILITALGLIMSIVGACKKSSIVEPSEQFEELPFKEYNYTSFTHASSIKPKDLGLSRFRPGTICVSNDTLFIADNTTDAFRLIVFDLVKKQKVATLESWKINNIEDKFSEPINHISVGDGKVFVSSNSSRVDVFDAKTLAPVGTVGQGIWWGDSKYNLVHAFASIVKDSLLYVRDKSTLVIFKLKDITPENYKKVPILAKSKPLGYNYDNLYHDIKFAPDSVHLILTDRNGRKLYFVDTRKVKQGVDLDLIDASKTVSLPGIPASFEIFPDAYLIGFQDGKLLRYDLSNQKYLDLNERLLDGDSPRAITRKDNKIWILTTGGWIDQISAETKVIKEYGN